MGIKKIETHSIFKSYCSSESNHRSSGFATYSDGTPTAGCYRVLPYYNQLALSVCYLNSPVRHVTVDRPQKEIILLLRSSDTHHHKYMFIDILSGDLEWICSSETWCVCLELARLFAKRTEVNWPPAFPIGFLYTAVCVCVCCRDYSWFPWCKPRNLFFSSAQ